MSCARGCCLSQREHYLGVVLTPLSDANGRNRQRDRTLAADMSAYRSMREQGLQPVNVNGSARIARDATSKFEVESGTILPDRSAVRTTESILGDIA